MSLNFAGATDVVARRTLAGGDSMPNQAPLTVCYFFRCNTNPGNFPTPWTLNNNDESAGFYTYVNPGDNGLHMYAGGFDSSIFTPTLGKWYFVAQTIDASPAGTFTMYYSPAGCVGALSTGSVVFSFSVFTTKQFTMGNDDGDAADFTGDIAGFRVWEAVLSSAEINNEYRQQTPFRTTNLWAFYPNQSISGAVSGTDVVDFSGHARPMHLFDAAALATGAQGPPVPWRCGHGALSRLGV